MAFQDPIIDKIVVARVGLLLRHPFFGNMATRLQIKEAEEWCNTAATDGRAIYFNRKFFEPLTTKQVEFVIAHEVLHNVFDHMGRREGRDPKIFNIAADYCVNGQIVRDRIGDHNIEGIKIFHDSKYYGWGAEQVYDDIYEKMDDEELAALGQLLDDHIDWGDQDSKDGQPKYSKEELKALADLFKKYPHITILSDEIYEYINFVGKHESIAQFEEIKDQIVVINGLSKGFAMTGWRLGYTASSVEIAKAMEKLQGQFTSGTCSITQKAAVTALVGDLKPSIEMTEEFTRRRTTTLKLVSEMPGFKCYAPEGAFYVFPDVSSYYGKSDGTQTIANAADFSMYLLNTAHVSSVMGDAFGEPNCVRFSFANSMTNIERAWARIKEALAKLK